MKVHLSSCLGDKTKSAYCDELGKLSELCKSETIAWAATPEDADIILIVDIFESNLYSGLRRNRVWRQWPEKSFSYCEGDYPPRFLRGLQSSARKSTSGSGRFRGCAYPVHQRCYPNPCLLPAEGANEDKDLLFSFAGRASHPIRKELFSLKWPGCDVLIEDTSHYRHFHDEAQNREEAHAHFWDLAQRSKYVLCPRGTGVSSVRIFEMMEAGIAPVIISDDWLPPSGPNWEEFALFVSEKEIAGIYAKVKAHESEFAQRGAAARRAWECFFSPEKYWDLLLASIREIEKEQKLPEYYYAKALPLMVFQEWIAQKIKHLSLLKCGVQNRILKLMRVRAT